MRGLRREEEWARLIVSRALGVAVVQHDDGSRERMHDLEVLWDFEPGAVEVTSAADGESIALWRLMNGRDERWIVEGLQGGWMVTLQPSARAKLVKSQLPGFLRVLEQSGITQLPLGRSHLMDHLSRVAQDLGVVDVGQSATDFPGSIYVTIELPTERAGGLVADTGDALATWVGKFLRETEQRDVLDKLARSGRSERHAFIFLPGFTTAPFSVTDLLMQDGAPLPLADADLPDEVTHVWLASSWASGRGFRWDPKRGWDSFDKLANNAA